MFTCSACGAVTAQAIGLGVSMAATPILFPLHKNTSTPSLARHHTQCEPVHGNTFQPELHHKVLSTSPVSYPALGPMDASGKMRLVAAVAMEITTTTTPQARYFLDPTKLQKG